MGRRALLSPSFDRHRKRWILSIPARLSETGKRKRKTFATESEATEEAKRLRGLRDSLGAMAKKAHPELIRTAIEFEEVAQEWGFESLRHFLREKFAELEREGASPPFGDLLDQFEADRRADWSAAFVRGRWRPFRKRISDIEDKHLSLLGPDHWREWFAAWRANSAPAPSTYNQQVSVLSQIFNHPTARKFHPRNPLDEIRRLKDHKTEVATFSAAQVRTVLEAAHQHDPELVPYFAVCFFAGLRPDSEALRVRFSDFHWCDCLLEVRETKTASVKRFVEIEPALVAWLAPWTRRKGAIVPPNFRRRRRWLLAGKHTTPKALDKEPATWRPLVPWSPDVSRHTYGSMWEAAHRSEDGCRETLAANMGHTSFRTFNQFYKQAKRPAEAADFWDLRPPAPEAENVVEIA
jgi:hypothetical protein